MEALGWPHVLVGEHFSRPAVLSPCVRAHGSWHRGSAAPVPGVWGTQNTGEGKAASAMWVPAH